MRWYGPTPPTRPQLYDNGNPLDENGRQKRPQHQNHCWIHLQRKLHLNQTCKYAHHLTYSTKHHTIQFHIGMAKISTQNENRTLCACIHNQRLSPKNKHLEAINSQQTYLTFTRLLSDPTTYKSNCQTHGRPPQNTIITINCSTQPLEEELNNIHSLKFYSQQCLYNDNSFITLGPTPTNI